MIFIIFGSNQLVGVTVLVRGNSHCIKKWLAINEIEKKDISKERYYMMVRWFKNV